VTSLYCAGECVPYSLLYCLPADVSRRQTIQTSSCNKSKTTKWFFGYCSSKHNLSVASSQYISD